MGKPFILFDFDGVLVDTFSHNITVFNELLPAMTREEMLDLYDGNGIATAIAYLERMGVDDIEGFIRRIALRFSELSGEVAMTEPARRVVESLSGNYEMMIVSTSREEGIEGCLQRSGMSGYFRKVYGQLAHRSKVEKIRMVFAEHGAAPDQCLFVTDTLGDILEAHEAGIKTLAVTWGFHGRERLAKGNPWAIVDSHKDINNKVENFFSRL